VKNIDLAFLHPGQTTRSEVNEKLKLIDTGYRGNHFFLGRWSSSTWGGWVILAGMCCEAVGGGGRVWSNGNLLVEFDDAGVVKRFETFGDSKAIRSLAPVAADTPLELASPLELSVRYSKNSISPIVEAKIVLSASNFDIEELGDAKRKHKFSLPAEEVLRVETPASRQAPDPTYTNQRLRCARDLSKIGGPRGRDINLHVTLPQLVTLMSYVSNTAKSAPGTSAK
jgi:hypothetical protein